MHSKGNNEGKEQTQY